MRRVCTFLFFIYCCLSTFGQSRQEEANRLYQTGLTNYRSGDYIDAIKELEGSIRLNPTARAFYIQGMAFQGIGKNLRSISAFEAALRLDPDYLEAKFQKALVYLQYGNAEQAVADLTELIDYDGSLNTRSIIYQTDQSGNSQNSIMTISGMKGNFYSTRGKAYHKLNKSEEAIQDFDMALSFDTIPDVLVDRALTLVAMNEMSRAVADLRLAITISPDHNLAWFNLALLDQSAEIPQHLLEEDEFVPLVSLLAAKAVEVKDYQLALTYLDQCVSIDSENPLSYINRGHILMKVDQYDRARNDFLKAQRIDPSMIECLYLIGNTFFHQKAYQQALVAYDQYLAKDYSNGTIWYNGAMCQLELKHMLEACHYLNRAHSSGMSQAKELLDKYCFK